MSEADQHFTCSPVAKIQMTLCVKFSIQFGCWSELSTSWDRVWSELARRMGYPGLHQTNPLRRTMDLLINYGDKAKNPSFSTARTFLSTLQDHYPERLGSSLILNVPFLLNAFYKLINPFIDPVSREKMKFNPRLFEDNIFTADMVMAEWWGGDRDFQYVHEKYWPALVGMCEERRQTWMTRWRALGGQVGLKEWDYKAQSNQESLGDSQNISGTGAESILPTA